MLQTVHFLAVGRYELLSVYLSTLGNTEKLLSVNDVSDNCLNSHLKLYKVQSQNNQKSGTTVRFIETMKKVSAYNST